MRKLFSPFLFAALFAMAAVQPGLAQERWHDGPGPGPHWRPDHPHGYDWGRWRRGGWINGWHEGRFGWWWVIDGAWFFYTAPVYPYPEPPAVVVAPPPQIPPGYYYYCPNPSGYYPAVPQCLTGWQMVPAAPAPVPAPVPVPPPPVR